MSPSALRSRLSWSEAPIPAGYLQDFNYDSERPMYLNFATTATTIGHEIIHGFDNNGRNFDENGKKTIHA